MTAAAETSARPPAFSPRVVLALVLVGVVSFAGLAVLSAYAPDLRAESEAGGNALSGSAVGFKGAVILLQARGVPTVVARTQPSREAAARSLVVLTPSWLDSENSWISPSTPPPLRLPRSFLTRSAAIAWIFSRLGMRAWPSSSGTHSGSGRR